MAKVNYYSLSSGEREKYIKEFFSAIADCKNAEEAERFFCDFLTLSEVVMFSRRIQVAKMLLLGKTHNNIVKKLKVGKTTIVMVDKWLNQGLGGYRTVFRDAKRKKRKINYQKDLGINYIDIKSRYPAHFWLINRILDIN